MDTRGPKIKMKSLSGEGKRIFRRDLGSIPVLVKAGGIIPLTHDIKGNQIEDIPEELDIEIFSGANGQFTIIEDKGVKDPDGASITTDISSSQTGADALITFCSSENIARKFYIRLRGVAQPDGAFVVDNGQNADIAYEYDNDECCMLAVVNYAGEGEIELHIRNIGSEPVEPSVKKKLYDALMACQIDYNLKSDIYNKYIECEKDNGCDIGEFLKALINLRVCADHAELLTDICS